MCSQIKHGAPEKQKFWSIADVILCLEENRKIASEADWRFLFSPWDVLELP
jgi:hypothetical protein